MNDKDNQTPGKPGTQGFRKEMIEELYRLAELIQDPSVRDSDIGAERKRMAAKRMIEILNAADAVRNSKPQPVNEHQVVLDLLLDLATYSKSKGLSKLYGLLFDTRLTAMRMLSKQ